MCIGETHPKAAHNYEAMRKQATLPVLLLHPPTNKDEEDESSPPTGSSEDHATDTLHNATSMKHRRRATALLHNVKQKLMVRRKTENSGLDDSHKGIFSYIEVLSFDDDEPTEETTPDDDSLTQEDKDGSIDSREESFHSSANVRHPLDICIRFPPRNSSSSDIPNLRGCLKHDYSPSQQMLEDSPRSVRFGHIIIREYNRALVDNPSVSEGPPIGLSWEYDTHETKIKVDEYENLRPPRRVKEEFLMPARVREEMLIREWGHTLRETRQASIEAKQIMQLREKAHHTDKFTEKLTEVLESSRRRFHRLKTGTTKKMEQEKLWKEASKWLNTTSDESSI